MIEVQHFLCHLHGSSQTRCIRKFKLKTKTLATLKNQKIQLALTMHSPEITRFWFSLMDTYDFLKRKPLPRCTQFRMVQQRMPVMNTKQCMENTTITEIDFGRFDLPLAYILNPGGQR